MPFHAPKRSACVALFAVLSAASAWGAEDAGFVKFRAEEIDKSLKVGYAVRIVDLNKDAKPDVLVCDSQRVIWFENPTWKLHTITQGRTRPDNVSIAVHDVNGDGRLDLALASGWTRNGNLQWLEQGENIDEPWKIHPIADEPWTHRIRFADLDGDGRPELVVAPLHNAGSTPKNNWSEKGVRFVSFKIPADPAKGPWEPVVIDETMHALHNFQPVDVNGDGKLDLLTASYEGVNLLQRGGDGKWSKKQLGEGNQERPETNKGSSEIKLGKLKNGKRFIATIEPWHGFETVVYLPAGDDLEQKWVRKVIDRDLKWGHAVAVADLDGDGGDELITGVRDPINDKYRSGVRVFDPSDDGAEWTRHVIDNGGVATEDAVAGDLNGDGRIDIVAVGRATGNVKIYWNEGAGK